MHEYNMKQTNTRFKCNNTKNITLQKLYFTKITEFAKEKDFISFIKSCESMIRNSYEYHIIFLEEFRSAYPVSSCALYKNLDKNLINYFPIEQHHAPLTLFDITTVIAKYIYKEYGYYNKFAIADTVIKEHFYGNVSLIPLSITIHELVHNGDIFLKTDLPIGNYQRFIDKYISFIPDEMLSNLKFKENLTADINNNKISYDFPVLDENITILNIKGRDLNLPMMNTEIKERIKIAA